MLFRSKNAYWPSMKKLLTNVFSNQYLNDIDSKYVIELYNKEEKTNIKYFNRLFILLCENNLIKDKKIYRILYFKSRLIKVGLTSDIPFILNSNIEPSLISATEFKRLELDLFFINLSNIEFKDLEMKKYANNFLDILKLEKNYSAQAKGRNCRNFCELLKNIFKDINLIDLNREFLVNKLNNMTLKYGYCLQLAKFLIYLNNLNLLKDKNLIDFVNLKDYILSGISNKMFIEILSKERIDRYVFTNHNKSSYRHFDYLNIESDELFNVLKEYSIISNYRNPSFRKFLNEFNKSFQGLNILTIDDLCFNSFLTQINYFKKYENIDYYRYTITFYIYIASKYNSNLFKDGNINSKILQYQQLSRLLMDGYKIIPYNPLEEIPTEDKWLLCYSNDKSNLATTTTESRAIDFSRIKDETYRYWYKFYVWNNTSIALYTRLQNKTPIERFFNYIHDLKTGEISTIYTKKNTLKKIIVNEVIAYKYYIINHISNRDTRDNYIYAAKEILQFIENCKICKFSKGVFFYLTRVSPNKTSTNKAISIPDDELKRLSSLMKEKSQNNNLYSIYYLIFYLLLETEFRSSQIFSLTVDCIEPASKKNEYILVSKTKVCNNAPTEQPITIYVKRQIEEIKKLTNEYRKNCNNDDLKKYLFLVPDKQSISDTYKLINSTSFIDFFKNCCDELNIPRYTISNLRDTHMTKAEEFIIRNQLSKVEQNVLSGHSSPDVDTKHYIDTQIKDLLEAVYGIIIGNVDTNGKILKDIPNDIDKNENIVSNDCGYCNSKTCNNFSYLDCIMCENFVTTIDRLPYFEEQVKILDKKIKNTTVLHDKEDLINIKRLNLNFIYEILKLKSQLEGCDTYE